MCSTSISCDESTGGSECISYSHNVGAGHENDNCVCLRLAATLALCCELLYARQSTKHKTKEPGETNMIGRKIII